ncbi:MAG: methyltransferase domain-containing protein [Gallionella sp.]|nr:methyltransferase domain-containing protein [Gallionella sp.]MDD4946743.1 methyltransferase domain-containing protein [Gallionella sp.]
MAHGYWGGKAPIINLLASKLVFLVLRWRLFSLKLRNILRTATQPDRVFQPPALNVTSKFQEFIRAGYCKLNIGGGNKNLDGFINIDFIPHPSVEREIVTNILDLDFIPADYATHIHSNHVIEHLTEHQLLDQLQQFRRILKRDGLLTIRCPNALGVAYGFWFAPILEQEKDEFVRCGFPEDEDFHNPADVWGHKDIYAFTHWIYGDVGNIANQHLNIITPTKLRHYLSNCGFNIIKMSEPEALNLVAIATKS